MIILTRARIFLLGAAVLVLAAGAVLGLRYGPQMAGRLGREAPAGETPAGEHAGQDMAAMEQPGERKVLYWYDPMHPAYKSDKPGIAPDCGMQLAPRYADELEALKGMAPGTVQILPVKQQLIGVRTATVAAEEVSQTVRAVGMVQVDETRVAHVHTKVSGWVRRVFVDYTWQHVHRGAPLLTLYSPELVSAQKEYLIARRAENYLGQAPYAEAAQGSQALLRASRERLKLWDVTDEQISELEARGAPQEDMTFYAPVGGHVAVRNVFPNQYITPESDLYTIVDHSRVWVQAELYEYEIGAVRVGQPATMTVEALPGRVFSGRIAFVDPHLDMNTRTLRVRLEFDNPELTLKPEMWATVEIAVPLGRQVVVPREAVIDTGTRQLVFLALPDGYFEPREIKTGPRLGERVVVLAGLRPGETIVTSAAFLVDSESQLSAAVAGLHAHPAGPEADRDTSGEAAAQLDYSSRPSPPRAGRNELTVRLRDASGQPITDAEVTVTFFMPAMPAMGMGAMQERATLRQEKDGEYRGELNLPVRGTWQVTVTARRQGQTVATRQFSVTAS